MNYDAIVIGAGPAGSTAAFLLARAGWNVAIIEKSKFPRRKVCGEFISAPALSLLAQAGLAHEVLADAGPEIREVAVFAGERVVTSEMPAHAVHPSTPLGYAQDERREYGRALGREHLDSRLLAAAARAGAYVSQPCRVERYTRERDAYSVTVRPEPFDKLRMNSAVNAVEGRTVTALRAPILIAAHGSWDTGSLQIPGRASDLLAFKAHFTEADLPPHRMPLIAFPGGYGGLVTTDGGRVSFSCCIKREALAKCRAESPRASAGAAVLAHVLRSTRGMREAIGSAVREGAWLAAGPLRPGIHGRCNDGCFTIGNAHGEAHPVVAEGISMAIQSAWLLCERLMTAGASADSRALDAVARDYQRAYRMLFEPRIVAASAFAALASRRRAAAAVASLTDKLPPLLGFAARWAGKTAAFPVDFESMQTPSTSR